MNLNIECIKREWESLDFKNILSYLSEKNIYNFVDVGANIGLSCQYIYKSIPTIKNIWLFEPDIENFNMLKSNTDYLKNTNLINKAIYYTDKEAMNVYGTGDKNAGGYFLEDVINDNVKIPTEKYNKQFIITTLEKEINTQIDLIKIDIEGSEYNLIQNSKMIQSINYLLIEFHWKNSDYIKTFIEEHLKNFDIIFEIDNFHHILLKKR